MKPTMTMLVCVLAAGLASAQNPNIIQNTRQTMNGVRDNAAAASDAALAMQPSSTPTTSRAATQPNGPGASTPKASGTAKAGVRKAVVHKHAKTSAPTAGNPALKTAAMGVPTAPISSAGENPDSSDQASSDKWSSNGKRDPFVSPVVTHQGPSGCSSGKKCLEIGAINLRGIVHSETGFIAVVSNGLNKAYFLRENDPVFNGYVVKITGDSIVFQETVQDKLGKTFTREVVKKITAPAV
jgi:hypothetical protein